MLDRVGVRVRELAWSAGPVPLKYSCCCSGLTPRTRPPLSATHLAYKFHVVRVEYAPVSATIDVRMLLINRSKSLRLSPSYLRRCAQPI